MSMLSLSSSSGEKIGFLIVAGLGCGCVVQLILIVAQASTTQALVAEVTANCSFWQVLGATIGIAVLSVGYTNQLTSQLTALLPPGAPIEEIINQPSLIATMPDDIRIPAQTAYVNTLALLFRICVAFGGILFLGSFGLRKKKLGADAMQHGGGFA